MGQMEARMMGQMEARMMGQMVGRMVDRMEDRMMDQMVDQMVDQMEGRMVDQMEGQMVDRMEGQMVDRMEGQMVELVGANHLHLRPHPQQYLHLQYWLAHLQELLEAPRQKQESRHLSRLHPRIRLRFPVVLLRVFVTRQGLQMQHQEGFRLGHLFGLLYSVQQMFFFSPRITPHTGHMARLK